MKSKIQLNIQAKTKNGFKKLALICVLLVVYTTTLFAQTAEKKSYQMFNTQMMKPKRGHEKQFEDAVKAHITKFHPAGPYAARLSVITDGSGSDGWYVWAMGPLTYTDLDKMPQGNKVHDDDWSKMVDVHVDETGESTFWKLQDELSFTPPNYKPERLDVWLIDIEPGMRYQFADLMKKWKGMFEAKKYTYAMRVFYNDLWSGKGQDVSIVYSFANYADFDMDVSWRNDYESVYGAGSWDNFWKAWNDCVVNSDEHLRKFIK